MPILHPERFQGRFRRRSYFEGWYFKQVSPAGEAWSFIPGLAFDAAGKGEAFVQAIDGSSGESSYFAYPASAFSSPRGRFELRVGDSSFSLAGARIRLGEGPGRIEAELAFGPAAAFPATLASPGIMGPFAWAPFMECRHGLVSLDHRVEGEIRAGGRRIGMGGGRGYIEKDWGSSMPSSWIWSQSNGFEREGDSFMVSVARIPWLGGSFVGFLSVLREGGRLRRFATYTGHRLESLEVSASGVALRIAGRGHELRFRAERERIGFLAAPLRGSMSRRIAEAVDARLEVELWEAGERVWAGRARPGGLELVGDPGELGAGRAPPPS